MIAIHAIYIGQPQTMADAQGTWHSSIFRQQVDGPVELTLQGLVGDRVTDTEHHGSPDQAVCCHPAAHYDCWNTHDGRVLGRALGPGSVGENWTLAGADEQSTCIGDIYRVGTARVQITGPRIPCWKQERKLGLPGFARWSLDELRTGFYVRVLTPGFVQAGDSWTLEARLHEELTQHSLNVCAHRQFDPDLARRLLDAPELGSGWRKTLLRRLDQHAG